jgi:putative tricarboxylic transport membrane protein
MKRQSIIAIFWLLLAFYVAYASYQLGLGSGGKPGAGFFPFGTALAIGAIALLRLVGVNREAVEAMRATSAGEWRKIIYVVAGMLAYALLLDSLGFAISTFLLLAFYLKCVAAQAWRLSVSFAVIAALSAHLFFDVLLHAQLPRGLLALLI